MTNEYVHGYSREEADRLINQAAVLRPFFEDKMRFPEGSKVLEAGCGVGAETVILAEINPNSHFTCIDQSEGSLLAAKDYTAERGLKNVTFLQDDILKLSFNTASFDHAFFCFVLEHLKDTKKGLQEVSRVVKPEGSIRAIECDLGTTVFMPYTESMKAIVDGAMKLHPGSSMGSMLESTMQNAGLRDVAAEKIVMDGRDPVKGDDTRQVLAQIIIPVYKGMKDTLLSRDFVQVAQWDQGISDFESIVTDREKNMIDTVYFAEGKPFLNPAL